MGQSSARHRAIRNSYCHSEDSFLSKARVKMRLLLLFWFFCHLAHALSESSGQHETQTKYNDMNKGSCPTCGHTRPESNQPDFGTKSGWKEKISNKILGIILDKGF